MVDLVRRKRWREYGVIASSSKCQRTRPINVDSLLWGLGHYRKARTQFAVQFLDTDSGGPRPAATASGGASPAATIRGGPRPATTGAGGGAAGPEDGRA